MTKDQVLKDYVNSRTGYEDLRDVESRANAAGQKLFRIQEEAEETFAREIQKLDKTKTAIAKKILLGHLLDLFPDLNYSLISKRLFPTAEATHAFLNRDCVIFAWDLSESSLGIEFRIDLTSMVFITDLNCPSDKSIASANLHLLPGKGSEVMPYLKNLLGIPC